MAILLLNKPYVSVGVGSQTMTIPATGLYAVEVQLTENPPTGLSLIVTQNGSTIYTTPTITPTQIAQQFKYGFQATAADAMIVTLSSSTPIDLQLNTVKWTLTIQQGL